MKVKREKHRAAIALPGAFFDVGGEEPPHVWGRAAACWVARRRRLRQAVRNATGGSHSYHVEAGGKERGSSGERGAKRGRRRARGRVKSGGGNVKILLPGTKTQGFAGSGEQTEKAFGPPE